MATIPQHQVEFPNTNHSPYMSQDYLSEPIHTSHDLAHSTGFSKPLGYNIECPRITPIQVTLVSRPPTKHRLKTSI